MEKQDKNDNAANRESYIGHIYNEGERITKEAVLASIRDEWSRLHREGYIHIHDLDAYGLTYNCLTFNILEAFPYRDFVSLSSEESIVGVFDFLKEILAKMGNEQSGGMSFANFDIDMGTIFTKLRISFQGNEAIFRASIRSLILWCNNIHTRMGQTSYYVTFCMGLGVDEFSRFLTKIFLEAFLESGPLVYKPNVVFKVHKGVNRFETDPNFDLLEQALLCTARKMVPTYLLCDSEMDAGTDPYKLSVMGCRTRVVADLYGEDGAIGRGNLANISINLPRLAFEAANEGGSSSFEDRLAIFRRRWHSMAECVKDILLDRLERTCLADPALFPTNFRYPLWRDWGPDGSMRDAFRHGTLSIGFIGLSEAMEILSGRRFYEDKGVYDATISFMKFMRGYTDSLTASLHINFSLLATSGELISGRFLEIDRQHFNHDCLDKGFYTNSFHINVDSKLPAFKKIQLEGPFHPFANGGSITYVELGEAPLGNAEGMDELLEIAIHSGVRYLGFNYPKDVCMCCRTEGTFDVCPACGSEEVTRIRRVSGYLEIADFFTPGKKNEVRARKKN